ncbi:MAG TPA: phosphoenolpyruvate carboxykinase (ATP) [Ginsengibacter sp.]
MDTFQTIKGSARIRVLEYFNVATRDSEDLFYQLLPEDLVSQAIEMGEGILSNTGALVINTGEFTGRSPKDRFIVQEDEADKAVNWNEFNQPIEEKYFTGLFNKMMEYIKGKKLWVRDCSVCAKKDYLLNIRVVNENPCCNLFAYNMFLRPEKEELDKLKIDWYLLQLPRFFADPSSDGVHRKSFVIINFAEKIILIGGTQYTGEIKKSVFSILNFILPNEKKVLSMHCAANVGKEGDSALFFGLSGTGKTTLSASPDRKLVGDDEHGWDDDSIFNIEGGCYAKAINLDPAKEPEIYKAARFGAIVENVVFFPGTNSIDFSCKKITENTRVSYPIDYISNALQPSIGKIPDNIFLLTADAFGILPPTSKLSIQQAIYYFISGYTAKVAGTEEGVIEPKPTFSECFGAPFLPLHPVVYAHMLEKKIKEHQPRVWLINTGWTGGEYGIGSRMKLEYTRAMVMAAIEGKLESVSYRLHNLFGLMMPSSCPGVPSAILDPEFTWGNKEAYLKAANKLAGFFVNNFKKYSGDISEEIFSAGPKVH